jgi:hypothetical protein
LAIRGRTVEILKNPILYDDLKGDERFAPVLIDTRNTRTTDAGNTIRRPGYEEAFDTGSDRIVALIPESTGYAIGHGGTVYLLGASISTLSGIITGSNRPYWAKYADLLIVCAGGAPVKLSPGSVTVLSGSPPANSKWVGSIANRVLMCGYNNTEVSYSSPGNAENWDIAFGAGSFETKADGESIKFFTTLKERAIFFKDTKIEVWGLSQLAAAVFNRFDGSWVDKGLGATDSVVKARGTLYWYGNDGDFYVLDGNIARLISKPIRRELNKLSQPEKIYGYDFRKENVIRWFAPADGMCFTYDYIKNTWSKDNRWENGQWSRLPINSYMELGKRAYIGDYDPTGKVYEWSEEFYDDDGQPIRFFKDLRVLGSGVGIKNRYNRLRLRTRKGNNVTGDLTVRWQCDEESWSEETLDIGDLGNHDPYSYIPNLGLGREIRIQFISTLPIDILLTEGYLTIEATNG